MSNMEKAYNRGHRMGAYIINRDGIKRQASVVPLETSFIACLPWSRHTTMDIKRQLQKASKGIRAPEMGLFPCAEEFPTE